jgi:hypothetical protein
MADEVRVGRPAANTGEAIIRAGLEIEDEGRTVTPNAIRNRIGSGNIPRIRQVWGDFAAKRANDSAPPVVAAQVLPAGLLEMLADEQAAYADEAAGRYLAIYRAVEAAFADRAAMEQRRHRAELSELEKKLAVADEANDGEFAARKQAEQDAAEAGKELATERRRADRLEDRLAAAETALTQARDGWEREKATLGAELATVRSELTGMIERAVRAEAGLKA